MKIGLIDLHTTVHQLLPVGSEVPSVEKIMPLDQKHQTLNLY